jgi:hypothetical protein
MNPDLAAIALLRILSATILVLAFFVDMSKMAWLRRDDVQLVLAVFVVAFLVFLDVYSGLFLGIALLTLYFRTHRSLFGGPADAWTSHVKDGGFLLTTEDYITPAHLERAQSNVFDERNGRQPMIGIEGVYGESVYDAQGAFFAAADGRASKPAPL